MPLYHQAAAKAAEDALKNGLKLTGKREMGDSQDIKEADEYLDARRPAELAAAGVRRSDNIYAFIGDGAALVDITTGQTTPLERCAKPGFVFLRLDVNEEHCYVSDLDRYDAAKASVARGEDVTRLASDYWQHVTPLKSYRPGTVRRPEVMVTRSIPARNIRRAD